MALQNMFGPKKKGQMLDANGNPVSFGAAGGIGAALGGGGNAAMTPQASAGPQAANTTQNPDGLKGTFQTVANNPLISGATGGLTDAAFGQGTFNNFVGGAADFLFGTDPSVQTGTVGTFTPEQQALFQQLQQMQGGVGAQGNQLVNQAVMAGGGVGGNTLAQLASGQGIDQMFQANVAAPLMQQFQDEVLPQLRARNASNLFSTESGAAEGRAGAGLAQALAGNLANMQFQGRLAAATPLFQGDQAFRQSMLQAGMQGQLGAGANLAQILGIPQQEAYAVGQPGQPGAMQGIFGGIGQGIGSGLGGGIAKAFSDARLKRNIRTLGFSPHYGVRVVEWDWAPNAPAEAKAQPTRGVIAQELQHSRPELVTQGADGYLRVNYAG